LSRRRPAGRATSGSSTISLRGIAKDYADVRAVGPVSLDIDAGQFVSILGPSGCGKTTTLRMIAGFESVSVGSILIDGKDVTDWPAERRRVGFVFQSYALFPHLSVQENVAFGLRVRRAQKAERELRTRDVLSMVGLASLGDRMPRELSAGQQQRVALARSLVLEPDVLLLDEPFSNLDLKLRLEMRLEVARLHRELGFTAVFVTHDQGEALSMSDRVVVMNAGQVEQDGSPQEVYERPRTPFVADFLGGANVLRVTCEAVSPGPPVVRLAGGDLLQIAGSLPSPVAAGAALLLAVRKEAIALRPVDTAADSPNTLRASIMDLTYTGDRSEFTLGVSEQETLRAEVKVDGWSSSLRVGDELTVSIPPEDVRPIDAEAVGL
jgi:ABC-type Fe3+/spermidine/putrescine transport system ATPase subunit